MLTITEDIADKVFFTADHHFGHENIIKFCERPFDTVEQMDAALIQAWNETVPEDGIVFHLGDFCLGTGNEAKHYFSQLNGQIFIIMLRWHHDRHWFGHSQTMLSKQKHVVSYRPPEVVLEVPFLGGKFPHAIHLSHYPLGEWDRKHYGSWHLHGHTHGNYERDNIDIDELCWDVGVDTTLLYKPVPFSWVLTLASESGWKPGE